MQKQWGERLAFSSNVSEAVGYLMLEKSEPISHIILKKKTNSKQIIDLNLKLQTWRQKHKRISL